MEYERIHKVQTGIISPSKLRMKLMGPHHQRKGDGSNSNSSRTSPSKLGDTEFVKNSLLDTNNGDSDQEVSSLEVSSLKLSSNSGLDHSQVSLNSCQPRDYENVGRVKPQQYYKSDTGNSSSVHPVRTLDEENLDYDSNASSSSFEFHKGERSVQNPITRSLLRPMSSKWNDAEKWIMNKQNAQANYSKKTSLQSQVNRVNKLSVKRVDFCQPESQIGVDRFSFVPHASEPVSSGQVNGVNGLIDLCPQSKDLKEADSMDLSCTTDSGEDTTGVPAIRAVSMRDMGTEMTPIPSQEPSRTPSPIGATTPLRSSTSSIQSTPERVAPTSTPTENIEDELQNSTRNGRKEELSELDLKLKTRREIVALGIQLGKTNIATWASKDDDMDKQASGCENNGAAEILRIEFEKRAVAWEEAEKCRHSARFKREEIKIQAWESQQKAKLEAEVRRIEAEVEQKRAQAQAKMVKKIAMARQRSEEKRAAAEARKNSQAEKTAAQVEYIRQTGRIPSTSYICCGW
ncbi:hypothetical protein LguiB_033860 [Lonicera macranthoides]